MSAQHRQNYAISPPKKKASDNLKWFCSGALLCCSVLGGITACQNSNSSINDSTPQPANSVTSKPSTLTSSQVKFGEKPLPRTVVQSSTPKSSREAIAQNTAKPNSENHSDSRLKTPIFPSIDRNNISNATRALDAPDYSFPTKAPHVLEGKTNPKEKIKPAKEELDISPQENISPQEENSTTQKQTNKQETGKQKTKKQEKLIKAISKVKTPQIFSSQQLGFSFKYPKGYVVNKGQNKPSIEPGTVQQRIDVWSKIDYQAIKSGKFQGSELPANVSISIEENPKRLNASEWLKENKDEFGTTQNQVKQFIAGQEAVIFHSSGLYEAQNIVLPNQNGNKVIVISHSQNHNYSNRDYEKVFEQVVSSFELRKHQ
ncbi:hypothetical protein [Mastigocoleus testarum]|uniref:Uncharacterized protein n=1 Tax=Mastigocoleus testarum BC008 TaxID=371196 RepID=A0A0V7ZFP9_9CYAN|nr:hypothetical protein [Mastigocoleus testarum]KST63309.1 hypothetical protein BC008_39185 [Mastigocoleus testarum BC008]